MNIVISRTKLGRLISTTTAARPHSGVNVACASPISVSLLNQHINVSLPSSRRSLSLKPGGTKVASCNCSLVDSNNDESSTNSSQSSVEASTEHSLSVFLFSVINNMNSANRIPKLTQPIVERSQFLATTTVEATTTTATTTTAPTNRPKSYRDTAREFLHSSLSRFSSERQNISNLLEHQLVGKTALGFVQRNLGAIVTSRPMPILLANLTARFMSTTSNQQRPMDRNKGSGEPILSEAERLVAGKGNKRINLNVCGELYSELAESNPNLYANAPKERGIDLELEYYDTSELIDPLKLPFSPVVCLLHGAPGRYHDFASLINYLARLNIRVIAPNFPDYSATFKHSFRHSPRERVDILHKFFQALNIPQVDLLVGHSSAVYTMFELLYQRKIDIRSLGLFSTPTYNLPPNLQVTPFRLFTLKLFDYPMIRPFIIALIHTFVKLQGIRNRVDKGRIENLLIAASAVGYSDCDKMSDHIKLVHQFRIPTYALVGGNDKLIPMTCFEQLKRDLGIKGYEQIRQYDEEGKLVSDASNINELVEVSEFKSGGHYTFQRFARQVNEDLSAFMRRKGILKIVRETTKL